MIDITMPHAQQGGPIGRRLFAQAAPMIGAAFGGPVGAAIGGMVGGKLSGQSTSDAALSGLGKGLASGVSGAGDNANSADAAGSGIVGEGAGGATDAMGRRFSLLGQVKLPGLPR